MTTVEDRTAALLEGVRRRRREIVTPEGAPLPVDLADVPERAAAFALDIVFQMLISLPIILLVVYTSFGALGGLVARSIGLFVTFLVRNFYFVYFEMRWQGATPGKRIVGLRVIDRRGGPLLPAAVIARNLTRELEAFLPLGALSRLGDPAGGDLWESLLLALWLLLFALLPLFNRDRMRVGDFIAGTLVIALPRRLLLRDVVETEAQFRFSDRQLRSYGAFEVQVLEELLRRPPSRDTARLLRDILEKIARKIEWSGPVAEADTERFLRDFYTAQRAFLEREQLFGRPREDKFGGETPAR